MTDDEQRDSERSRVWLPIRVVSDRGEALGVTHDVSEKGVLVLSAEPFEVGMKVALTIHVPSSPPRTVVAAGRVVHAGPNLEDPGGLWRHRFGVVLDEPLGEALPVILGLLQSRVYRSKG